LCKENTARRKDFVKIEKAGKSLQNLSVADSLAVNLFACNALFLKGKMVQFSCSPRQS